MSEEKGLPATWTKRHWAELSYDAGAALDRQEAQALEKFIEDNHNDCVSRIVMLGYYDRARHRGPKKEQNATKFLKHLIWIIDNAPGHPDLEQVLMVPGEAGCQKASSHWRKAVRENPDDVAILANAARFFCLISFSACETLWKKVIEIEPGNEEWHRLFSHAYLMHPDLSAGGASLPADHHALDIG